VKDCVIYENEQSLQVYKFVNYFSMQKTTE